jgi:DNA polymerase I
VSKFAHLAARLIIAGGQKHAGLRLAFDIEANALLDSATVAHCVVVADLVSDRIDEYGPDRIAAALEHLTSADYLTGHNIVGYDLPLLRRLYGWTPGQACTILDTLVTARLILPNLPDLDDQAQAMGGRALGKLRGRYSIEAWGARLGIPKIGTDIEDWSHWTPEMQERCVGDVAICKTLWHFLQPDGYSQRALELEHLASAICDAITAAGAPFNAAGAGALHQQWTERRAELAAQLGQQFPGTKLSSRKQIGALLEARGWVPEERTEKTKQPKINAELLETIPASYPEFAGLAEYMVLSARLAQLTAGEKAWRSHIGADGRIHGGVMHIGTPHSRAKHLEPNLAAVPNPKKGSPFGTECRALFRPDNGFVCVAADQAGLQDRGFAHYLHDFDAGTYARTFLTPEDTHWKTVTALGLVPDGTARLKDDKVHTAIREGGKRFRYAFLYGCPSATAGRIIYDTARAAYQIDSANGLLRQFFGDSPRPSETALRQIGGRARKKFITATPGLGGLLQSLEAHAEKHKWLPGLDGRRVPVRAQYPALNYIVTSSEAIICKRWVVRVYDELCARFRYGWDGDAVIVLWVHDEIVVCCRPEIAEQVGEILVRNAKEPAEFYGFKVPLDADYKIGRSWAGEPVGGDGDDTWLAPEPITSIVPEEIEEVEEGESDLTTSITPDETIEVVGTLAPDAGEVEIASAVLTAAITDMRASIPRGTADNDDAGKVNDDHADDDEPQYARNDQERQRIGRVVATYLYRNHLGDNHTRIEKRVSAKLKRAQYPQAFWVGRWVFEKPDGWQRIPYRLPELLVALAQQPVPDVFLPEGEKDCDSLAAIGLVATTNSEGATPLSAKSGKWTPELNKWFHGVQRLFILADNDEVGRLFALEKVRALKSIVPDIRLVYFPDVPEHEDVTYGLEHGHNKEELLTRCAATASWQAEELQSLRADQVVMPAVYWLWLNRFALGKLGLIVGLPDEGKGLLLSYIASQVTTGGAWPLSEGVAARGNVLLLSAEDDPNDTVVPRLVAAGADLSRIEIIKMVREEGTDRMFSLQTDLSMLRRKITAIGNVVLVLIDPISAYLGVGKMDSYRTTDVRAVLGPVVSLAAELELAIIGIMHFNKKLDVTNALLRISDSLAYGATARHVYGVIDDAENHRKLLVRAKNNLALNAGGQTTLAFSFGVRDVGVDPNTGKTIVAPYVIWESQYVDVTATEAMQAASENKSPGARDEAKKFLLAILASGPVAKTEIEEAAKAEGISERTLYRAKRELNNVIAKKDAADGRWTWRLCYDGEGS